MSRPLVMFIAMSLDGYIVTNDHNIDFLSKVELPGEDYGYNAFTQEVDTVIWGRKTYDKVKDIPGVVLHPDKQVYVMSRSKTGTEGNIIYHHDVVELVRGLKEKEGKTIYCDGGAEIVFQVLQAKMVDRMIVSVIPHLLGSGIRLFGEGIPEQEIALKYSATYPSGLVQLWYDVKKAAVVAS